MDTLAAAAQENGSGEEDHRSMACNDCAWFHFFETGTVFEDLFRRHACFRTTIT